MKNLGEFTPGKTIVCRFNTHKADGTPITLAGTPAVSVYKNSTTESTSGVTLTVDYDSRTGLHHVAIDTSADGTFYAAGNDFDIVITTGTVDSVSVVGTVVGTFSLSNRAALRPTTADRTLDVSSGGEAGIDLANVGSPTTTLNLSGTTIKTATDVEADTTDIQSRLPASLVSGRIDASVGAMAANTLTASALATDAVTEIQAGLSTLDAAGIRTAIGLASANLDTQLADLPTVAEFEARTIAAASYATAANLATVAGYLDTEIAAILADTDELQQAWADGGRLDLILDARASQTSVDTIDDLLDTEIAAIKADTAAILLDTGTDGVVVAAGSKTGYSLAAAGLDSVITESGISAGAGLTNDTGTQLTAINARQAISAILSAAVGVLSGVSANTPAFKQAGKPAGNTRISATVTSDGRTAVTLKVPD